MGESKNNAAQAQERVSPLTREELVQKLNEATLELQDLKYNYSKATSIIQQLQQQLRDADFSYSSFYLSMLFKVMENPAMFSQEFVTNCAQEIENALTSFHQAMTEAGNEAKDEA